MIATPLLRKARTDELTTSEYTRAVEELRAITPPHMAMPWETRMRHGRVAIIAINGTELGCGDTAEDALAEAYSAVLAELADA